MSAVPRQPIEVEDLVDRIYECAFAPDLWPAVLDALAAIAEAQGGLLLTAREQVTNWTASETIHGNMQRLVDGEWMVRGMRFKRLAAARHPGFLVEQDLYPDEDMAADPFYRDFLWRGGFGWGSAFGLKLPTGDTAVLSVERLLARGPVEPEIVQRLDVLRPHLARSILLSARLQLERAQAASETLARIGLPALVVDDHGRVLAANALIETLAGHVRWLARDRVALRDPAADNLFRQAIVQLESGASPVRSFAVRHGNDQAALVAHVVPIRGAARDVFVRCAATLVLTPVARPDAPPADLIQSLFDLTPAEARVARHLAGGSTVEEIATSGGVSSNTVRTQVRGVLEKTGCRRQTEIVALLGGVSIPRG